MLSGQYYRYQGGVCALWEVSGFKTTSLAGQVLHGGQK